MSSINLDLSKRRMTIFSPKSVGRQETRKSMSFCSPPSAKRILMRPSWGSRFSAMSSFAMILIARRDRVAHLERRRHDVVEDAVDAVADAVFLLVRLDVDVARALADRRHQDHVHELDDRRFLALAGQRLGADLLEILDDFDVGVGAERGISPSARLATSSALSPGASVILGERGGALGARRRCVRPVVQLDRVDERRLRRHDGFDVVARHELHVVHGEHVGRVGHRDRQRRPGAAERDDLVLAGGLGGNELDDRGVDLELIDGDRRHAVLLRQQRRNLVVFDEVELDEIRPELAPILALIVQRFLELLRSDALLFEKQFANTDGHGGGLPGAG